jgi:hypothetical protein
MLRYLGDERSPRKYRLLCIGFCRYIAPLVSDSGRYALYVAERHADSNATTEELDAANLVVQEQGRIASVEQQMLLEPITWATWTQEGVHLSVASTRTSCEKILKSEGRRQRNLVRCIFGNPFRPVTLNSKWLTPTVKQLAEQIYNERAFDRMPILADALEEAGCTVKEVLEHCRNSGEHVRGCWVVDKVLGRE